MGFATRRFVLSHLYFTFRSLPPILEKCGSQFHQGIKNPDLFVYTPPVPGRPVGLLPYGYKRPTVRPVPRSLSSPTPSTDATSTAESSEERDVIYDTDSEAEYSDSEDNDTTKSKSAGSFGSSTSGYSGSTATSRSPSRDDDESGSDDESGTGSGGFSLGDMRNGSTFESRGSTLTAGSGGETEQ